MTNHQYQLTAKEVVQDLLLLIKTLGLIAFGCMLGLIQISFYVLIFLALWKFVIGWPL